MPYMLTCSVSDGSSTAKEFVPEFEDRRIYAALGLQLELTEQEIAQIPRSLRVDVKRSWKKLPEVLGWSTGRFVIAPDLAR